jgi:hypothetical protein
MDNAKQRRQTFFLALTVTTYFGIQILSKPSMALSSWALSSGLASREMTTVKNNIDVVEIVALRRQQQQRQKPIKDVESLVPFSQVLDEIDAIEHYPFEQKIVIRMKKEVFFNTTNIANNGDDDSTAEPSVTSGRRKRKCINPKFVGRVSGQHLTTIQWTTQEFAPTARPIGGGDDDEDHNKSSNTHADSTTKMNTPPVESVIGYYTLPSASLFRKTAEESYHDDNDDDGKNDFAVDKYHIEIVAIYCNDLLWETDFTYSCVESPLGHRMTSNEAYIHINSDWRRRRNMSMNDRLGHWSIPPTEGRESFPPEPVYTRFQGQGCRNQNAELPRCTASSNISALLRYQHFIWEDTLQNNDDDRTTTRTTTPRLPREMIVSLSNKMPPIFIDKNRNHSAAVHAPTAVGIDKGKDTICYVGLSHSRVLTAQSMSWLNNVWGMNVTNDWLDPIRILKIEARYPTDITANLFKNKVLGQSCSATIIAVGQWAGGKRFRGPQRPTIFPEFYHQMEEVIRMTTELARQHDRSYKVYFRSIHYNPLGDLISMCPNPKDWRSPSVIDGYNYIISYLAKKYNAPYIDTNFIIGPMWDSAPDYCHVDNFAGELEALYLMHYVLYDKYVGISPNHTTTSLSRDLPRSISGGDNSTAEFALHQ